MKIAITGEKGFIGTHLTIYFRNILKYEVIELGKDFLNQLSTIKELDWLIHGAFVHRNPDPNVLLELNRKLTNDTIKCLEENNLKCNIAFLSSYQEDLDSAYGQSKRETKMALSAYCSAINKEFVSFKFHNIFGIYAVPNRTSFIATFCYNLHNGLPINFNTNKIKVICVKDILPTIANFKDVEIKYQETTVEEVYNLLQHFHELNLNKKFPELNTKYELDLYDTYLSYSNYKI